MVGRFRNVNVHFAGSGAFPAGNTFVLVHLHLEQRHLVEQGVECAEGTYPFAEGAEEQHAEHHHGEQNGQLPGEKRAQRRPYSGVHRRERNCTLKNALGTEIFAEERVAYAHVVHDNCRKKHHRHRKDDVFEIGERFELLRGELLRGNFVQQLLKPAERAKKSAYKAAEQHAEQNKKTRNII